MNTIWQKTDSNERYKQITPTPLHTNTLASSPLQKMTRKIHNATLNSHANSLTTIANAHSLMPTLQEHTKHSMTSKTPSNMQQQQPRTTQSVPATGTTSHNSAA